MVDPTLSRFSVLNVWKRGGARAPHKPLLVLYALGELSRGNPTVEYSKAESALGALLREFGPSSSSIHPEYPFWRLQNDGVWTVSSERPMRPRASNSDPPRSELRAADAKGSFSPEIVRVLRAQPALIAQCANQILSAHFPASLHDDIRDAVGLQASLEVDDGVVVRRSRDPAFRRAVLAAYAYRCAVCGLDVRVCNVTVGLEAAHIRWHQADGPDSVDNGLALCTLHHKLFDFGAITLGRAATAHHSTIVVSDQVHGTTGLEEVLLRHSGKPLASPVHAHHRPSPRHIEWHRREVFKGIARPAE
jgi:putative restriction endonuclease